MIDALRARRSVRRFKADAVPRAMIEQLIEAAVTAPSASNKQPWRFLVVTRPSLIADLAAAVRDAVGEIAEHVPAEGEASFRAYGDYFTRFERAPAVIVPIFRGHTVLSNLVDGRLAPARAEQIARMERDSGLVGASLALQNLLLMAHHLGLGASPMTGPLVAEGVLKVLLDVPGSWGIVALVAVGFPDETPSPTDRKPIDKVTRWIE